MRLERTPSQTVGPYLALGLSWDDGPDVVAEGAPGAFWIRGQVLDGRGDPVPDALVETWQADTDGRFAHPADDGSTTSFRGFGRSATDAEGRWGVRTVKPGIVARADGRRQAPHVDVSVFSRGLLTRLVTRIYFGDEAAANEADDVLLSIADTARKATLIATQDGDGYVLDIRLQGEDETVFFDA